MGLGEDTVDLEITLPSPGPKTTYLQGLVSPVAGGAWGVPGCGMGTGLGVRIPGPCLGFDAFSLGDWGK